MLLTYLYIETILIVLFCASLIVLLISHYIIWVSFLKHQKQSNLPSSTNHSVTILICVHNEQKILRSSLERILDLGYPVMVIDDCSVDDTSTILKALGLEFQNLQFYTLKDKIFPGKKYAFYQGLCLANTEFVLCTDIDCSPSHHGWVEAMLSKVSEHTDIVLGYSPYVKANTFLNGFIQYETWMTALQYLGFAMIRRPYMGVGRNLLVRREKAVLIDPFKDNMHIPSGDDDILVNSLANSSNTEVCLEEESHVWSIPQSSWMAYFRQKRRHVSAGDRYKSKDRLVLGIISASIVLFYIGLFYLLWSDTILGLLIWSIKCVLTFILLKPALKVLKFDLLWYELILYDLGYAIYLAIIFPVSLLHKPNKWN